MLSKKEMQDYWDSRFLREGYIWSEKPSESAKYANRLFNKYDITDLLIPGIGYGRNSRPFLESGYNVSGIEISEVAIELLKKSELSNKIKVFNGSLIDMPFEDIKYDAIFSFNVLHLFNRKNRQTIMDKCKNQLKPNGLIFFTVMSELESGYSEGIKIEENTFVKKGKPVHFFTEEDMKQHFRKFEIIESDLIDEPEQHSKEGKHTHKCRYIFAINTS
ncbi:MAG: methyltransferase domain-containing protein [Planctomycetes bacterium]|nr:methyltransferase domain-containing protein [Planctomycetota bacterium]